MKKHNLSVLVLITCIFVAFTVGFRAGRDLNRAPVRILQIQSQTAEPVTEADAGPTGPAVIDINSATAAQLEALPGIGPVLAGRIVAYRDVNGSFRAVEELTKVKGIGAAILEEIWDLITVGG